MGLDMYLTKHTYTGRSFNRRMKLQISAAANGKRMQIDSSKVKRISEEAAYWRKANAIHNWFVINCQDGRDECQETQITEEHLRTLLELVECVLESRSSRVARKLLPPQAGFFFGSTEIDTGYWEDMKYTKEVLTDLLSRPLEAGQWYTYQSSW